MAKKDKKESAELTKVKMQAADHQGKDAKAITIHISENDLDEDGHAESSMEGVYRTA